MTSKIKLLFLVLLFPAVIFSQDTIRVMTYNILNYDGGPSSKNENLKKIVEYVDPDILVVEEIETTSAVSSILNNVLSKEYSAGDFVYDPLTSNAVYYKTQYFDFLANNPIETDIRDISEFVFRYKKSLDTLIVYGVHLKASSGSDNEQKRLSEVIELRNVTDSFPPGKNYLIVGDFNIYSSLEPAYQKLVDQSGTGYFIDPINASGVWNNSSFASIHTQSTRTTNLSDGGSSGGLDDRFDMILYSQAVSDAGGIEFLDDSYTNVGNDGNHYNQSINQMPNNAVSQEIANALYYASDHLPVYADFTIEVDTTLDYFPEIANMERDILVPLDDQPFTVSANVTDDKSISEVKLNYALDGDSTGSLLMESENGFSYNVSIPADLFESGELFEYWISAADSKKQITSNKENMEGFFAGVTSIYKLKRTDLNGNLLYKDYYARIEGSLTVPDSTFSTYYLDVYVQDSTGGINIFKNAAAGKFDLKVGSVYRITGMIDEFYGKTEFVPDDPLLDIVETQTTNMIEPEDISIDELFLAPDYFEGNLIRLSNVTKVSGNWATEGSNENIIINDGSTNNLILRIDKDTNIDGTQEPDYPTSVIGIFAQYDETSPFSDGYQILPRSVDDFKDTVVSVSDNKIAEIDFRLYQNYPNPFNPSTKIKYSIPQSEEKVFVRIKVYDLLGNQVRSLVEEERSAGSDEITFDGSNLSSGVYFYRIEAGKFTSTKKMQLVK